MPVAWLLGALGVIIALLCLWAFWLAPRLGQPRLELAQRSAMIALHTVTAVAILAAGILYVDEQQWSPRLGVEVKADARLVPRSNPQTAVVQLAIAITNKTETNQSVNFIDVAAFGIRGPARRDPGHPQDLAATPFYRLVTTQAHAIGPEETISQFVEIPVACAWPLIRVSVAVPKPPARPPRPGQARVEYERKLLVPIADVCAGIARVTGATGAVAAH